MHIKCLEGFCNHPISQTHMGDLLTELERCAKLPKCKHPVGDIFWVNMSQAKLPCIQHSDPGRKCFAFVCQNITSKCCIQVHSKTYCMRETPAMHDAQVQSHAASPEK